MNKTHKRIFESGKKAYHTGMEFAGSNLRHLSVWQSGWDCEAKRVAELEERERKSHNNESMPYNQLAGEIRDYIEANNNFLSDFPVAGKLLSRSEELLKQHTIS